MALKSMFVQGQLHTGEKCKIICIKRYTYSQIHVNIYMDFIPICINSGKKPI